MPINKYPKALRFMHWLIVGLVSIQVAIGILLEDFKGLFYIHIVFGILVLLAAVVRIAMRRRFKTTLPPRPEYISQKRWNLAQAGHFILYIFLLLVPVSGIFAVLYKGIAEEIHGSLVFIFVALIVGHIAMAMKYMIIDRQNILERIT